MEYSTLTGDPFVYWTFYVLLLLCLTICGYGIGYYKPEYRKRFAVVAVSFFALVEGLRWLRGADYYNYYYLFVTGKSQVADIEEMEPIFREFCYFVSFVQIPPPIIFVFLSAILIGSFVMICRNYKKAAVWCLPVMFLLIGNSTENIVRQYFATTFLIFAYYFYTQEKYKLMLINLAIVPLIHSTGIYAVLLFLLFIIKYIPFKWPYLYVVIYLAAFFLWDIHWFDYLSDYIQESNIETESRYQHYLDNSERFFTEEGSISVVLGKTMAATSVFFNTSVFLTDLIWVYFGFKACKDDKKLHIAYFFGFIGLIIKMIAHDIELIGRFALWTNWMIPFVLGVMFYKINFAKYKYLRYVIVFCFCLRFVFYGVLRQLGTIPYAGCGFIWDK